ncbi:MAG: hypothetical protein JWO20_2121 [Candidatus Angelobacter sp.]|jgi:hypothetical protein|nr:hypothetical protein [Candidatus Angelobacter sp.]
MQNATTADAELILHLYELRTDECMRKARKYVTFEFSPRSIEDVIKLQSSFGSDENSYYRQVLSYWEMAASFVTRGALNVELFSDSAGELFFLYAKFRPFIAQIRETNPLFLTNMEKVVSLSKENQDRVERMVANIAAARAAAAHK